MNSKHERATGICTHIIKEDIDKYKRTIKYKCDICGEVFEIEDYITFNEVFGGMCEGYDEEDYIDDLLDENEKLKKAIEYEIELLFERRFNAYACDNYEVYNVIDAIIEELKEVLGNANN